MWYSSTYLAMGFADVRAGTQMRGRACFSDAMTAWACVSDAVGRTVDSVRRIVDSAAFALPSDAGAECAEPRKSSADLDGSRSLPSASGAAPYEP